jgi:hypothetical protein
MRPPASKGERSGVTTHGTVAIHEVIALAVALRRGILDVVPTFR